MDKVKCTNFQASTQTFDDTLLPNSETGPKEEARLWSSAGAKCLGEILHVA